jgi:hypothetical protein
VIFTTVSHCPQVGTLIEAEQFLLTHRSARGDISVRVDHHGHWLDTFKGKKALVDAMTFCSAIHNARRHS